MNTVKIDGILLKRMIIAGANEIVKNKQYIDSLNVFPVPDGDTGTNMSLTCLSAAKEVLNAHSTNVEEVAKLASNGSLRGARGNSGVILSQLYRGFAKGLKNKKTASLDDLAHSFRLGMETAYKAVMKPKEGTIITIARAVAEKSEEMTLETDDLDVFGQEVLTHAKSVLARTKEMLPQLKAADVVDAGGYGLLCILEGAYNSIFTEGDIALASLSDAAPPADAAPIARVKAEITYGYCTEFFIHTAVTEKKIKAIKEYYSTIGDSLLVVSDDEIIKIHVHTDHPGLVLEKALAYGSLSSLKIENMREQHTSILENNSQNEPVASAGSFQSEKNIGCVTVSIGEGFNKLFANIGADKIIEGGQTMNPSAQDILDALTGINAKNILIFPNNKNIILAAEQAAKLCMNKNVRVIPTKTLPQGINAMINLSLDKSFDENATAMIAGIDSVKTGLITYAVRNTEVDGHQITTGDILGMVEGEIHVVEKSVSEAASKVLKEMMDDKSDLITIYYGADVTGGEAEALSALIQEQYPSVEVELSEGGQPLYYYILSVE